MKKINTHTEHLLPALGLIQPLFGHLKTCRKLIYLSILHTSQKKKKLKLLVNISEKVDQKRLLDLGRKNTSLVHDNSTSECLPQLLSTVEELSSVCSCTWDTIKENSVLQSLRFG